MSGTQLYLTLATCLGDDAARAGKRLERFTEWEDLARIASASLVAPALYPALRRKQLLAALPRDFAGYLETLTRLNARRNAELRTTLIDTVVVLNRHGLTPGLLKGAIALLEPIFGDPGERVLGDLDLLAERDTYAAAEAGLRAGGYRDLPRPRPAAPSRHEIPLVHPQRRGVIELHRCIVNPGRGLAALESLERALEHPWSEARCGAARYRTPAPAFQFAHRFIHDMVHDPGYMRGWISMRGLYDAYRIEQQALDLPWPRLEGAFKAAGVWDEWQAYREVLEGHFPSLPRRARPSLRTRLWGARLALHQDRPWIYAASRGLFQALRGRLPRRWLRDRGW